MVEAVSEPVTSPDPTTTTTAPTTTLTTALTAPTTTVTPGFAPPSEPVPAAKLAPTPSPARASVQAGVQTGVQTGIQQWTHITVEADERRPPGPPEFPRTGWGHRGYDPEPVDTFIDGLLTRLGEGGAEIEDLRRELDRLHRYIRREWSSAGRSQSSVASTGSIALAQAEEVAQERLSEADRRLVEARALALRRVEDAGAKAAGLLSEAHDQAAALIDDAESQAAQRLAAAESMAEQALARAWNETTQHRDRAEQTARTALTSIQTRYQEIVVRAHQRAEQAASNALHDLEQHATGSDDPAEARAELQLRAAYLRTSAEVSRAAMRAALTFAAREFDRLTGQEHPPPTTPPPAVSVVDLPT